MACRALQCLQVSQRKGSILEQVRNKQSRRATEQIEQIPYYSLAVLALIEGRLKELRIADLLYFSQRTLLLKPINESLHCGVRNAFIFREAFQNLAHRGGPQFPVLFQETSFGF
jgi:hypothetical protein